MSLVTITCLLGLICISFGFLLCEGGKGKSWSFSKSNSDSESNSDSGRNGKSRSNDGDYDPTEFEAFTLEGGICGRGEDYTYFVRKGDPEYVAFLFFGSAFCYDEASCLLEPTEIDIEGFQEWMGRSDFLADFPLNNEEDGILWTIIAAPQCTEDFHLGNNVANLGTELPEFHFKGGINIELLIEEELLNTQFNCHSGIDIDSIKHLVVWGASSGGYGAAVWSHTLFSYVNDDALKTLIIDSFAVENTLFQGVTYALGLATPEVFNFAASPGFASANLISRLPTLDISLTSLLAGVHADYCDSYISLLFFEYDFVLVAFHVSFTQNNIFEDVDFWKGYLDGTLLPQFEDALDEKRFSYYVASGINHVFVTPYFTLPTSTITTESDIATECPNAPTGQEYLSLVVGGSSDVEKYYGNNKRMHTFPKYSWNNLDIECLQCA